MSFGADEVDQSCQPVLSGAGGCPIPAIAAYSCGRSRQRLTMGIVAHPPSRHHTGWMRIVFVNDTDFHYPHFVSAFCDLSPSSRYLHNGLR